MFNQSYGIHITPLVANSIGGRHTHTYTYKCPHRKKLRNQAHTGLQLALPGLITHCMVNNIDLNFIHKFLRGITVWSNTILMTQSFLSVAQPSFSLKHLSNHVIFNCGIPFLTMVLCSYLLRHVCIWYCLIITLQIMIMCSI